MKVFLFQIFIVGLVLQFLGICRPIWAGECINLLKGGYSGQIQPQLAQAMHGETFSQRVLDADGDVGKHIRQILLEYRLYGAIHVTNTGLNDRQALLDLLPELGFTPDRNYDAGGRASTSYQEKWVVPNLLRNLDAYPPQLYLLPNTEVQYSKVTPKDVLFFVDSAPKPGRGGRIFLHPIHDIESAIAAQTGGRELLERVRKYGLRLVTGYVDERHPERAKNYFKSWQELSGQSNLSAAVRELQKRKSEYDNVWPKEDPGGNTTTIMTSIAIPGFRVDQGEEFLNIPRVAASAPTFENGYRAFQFGQGKEFTETENGILLNAYFSTRQGGALQNGDFLLADNTRTAHSRESFDPADNRRVLVGMSGTHLAENLSADDAEDIRRENGIMASQLNSLWEAANPPRAELPRGLDEATSGGIRYWTPPAEEQYKERFSMRVYNLAGRDLADPSAISEIVEEFAKHGHLHIINNQKYVDVLPQEIMKKLGFGDDKQFQWGGTNSGRTVRSPLGSGFHSVDKYPAGLPLLAHNEILYQRILPLRMMFHYREVSGEGHGGRTFVHSATNMEKILIESGPIGKRLAAKLKKYGQLIRTGFMDQDHPEKNKNFVRSWQDRFGTNDIDEAVRRCNGQRTHFDRCWKMLLSEKVSNGRSTYMLMTDVTMPMVKKDLRDGRSYMMFPRIAYDGPSLINGFRQFHIGNGKDFTPEERGVLISAFWQTREGIYQNAGDIILLDNIRYGHSREPYVETDSNGRVLQRRAAVVMAGEFHIDEIEGQRNQNQDGQGL